MSENIEPVSFKKHGSLKVKQTYTFDHVKADQFIPINVDEFAHASTGYPIFFIKDRNTASFFPIALFGLEQGENLFYSPDQWPVCYVPKMLGTNPFSIRQVNTDENKWAICIDTTSSIISDDKGENLYVGSDESPFLKGVRDALTDFYSGKLRTAALIECLLSEALVKPVRFKMEFADGNSRVMDGLYTLDAGKMETLSETTVQKLYQAGYLPAIYAMLSSQHNLFDLVKRKRSRASGSKMVSLKVVDA